MKCPQLQLPRAREILSQDTHWSYSLVLEDFSLARSHARQRFVWKHHGDQGSLAYLVTLSLEQEPDKPRLALNTYCRPFPVPPSNFGIWCPEGRNLRLTCFDPDSLKPFDLAELAGWFKQSSDRISGAPSLIADFEVPLTMEAGTHSIEVPKELADRPRIDCAYEL